MVHIDNAMLSNMYAMSACTNLETLAVVATLRAPAREACPVRTLTRTLTGLTGCACLAAVALWGMRGT